MLNLNNINVLNIVSKDYDDLASSFKTFADYVKTETSQTKIEVSVHDTQGENSYGWFTTKFAGHLLYFAFSSHLYKSEVIESNESLKGKVECYIEKNYSEHKKSKLGEFTFNTRGYTNIKEPEENSFLNIKEQSDVLIIVFQYIYKSLSETLVG